MDAGHVTPNPTFFEKMLSVSGLEAPQSKTNPHTLGQCQCVVSFCGAGSVSLASTAFNDGAAYVGVWQREKPDMMTGFNRLIRSFLSDYIYVISFALSNSAPNYISVV